MQNENHATTSPSDESQYISHACTEYSIVSVLLPCTELTPPVHTTSQYRRFFTGRPDEFWECCCWDSATRDFLMCEVNPNLKWKPVVLTRLNHSKFSLSQISWSHSTCHPPNSFNVQESQSEGAAGWEKHRIQLRENFKLVQARPTSQTAIIQNKIFSTCRHAPTLLMTNYMYVNQTAALANYLKRLMEDGLGSKRILPACGW